MLFQGNFRVESRTSSWQTITLIIHSNSFSINVIQLCSDLFPTFSSLTRYKKRGRHLGFFKNVLRNTYDVTNHVQSYLCFKKCTIMDLRTNIISSVGFFWPSSPRKCLLLIRVILDSGFSKRYPPKMYKKASFCHKNA